MTTAKRKVTHSERTPLLAGIVAEAPADQAVPPSRKRKKAAPDGAPSPERPASLNAKCGEMHNFLGYDLRRASLLLNSMANNALAPLSVRTTWVSVLEVISQSAGLKQSQIADTLDIKKANLVAILNALEQRGAVRRLPAPADRRAHSLHLTASGRLLLKQAKKISRENEKEVIDRIGKETHSQLIQTLCMLRTEFSKLALPSLDDEE